MLFPLPDGRMRDIVPGALILDLGCGTGRRARELAAAGFRVVALDMDFDAVTTGRELAGTRGLDEGAPAVRLSFIAARAEALPFPRGAFAAVLCVDVLHWSRDDLEFEAVWRGAWDALEPGGWFLVRTLLRDRIASAAPLADGRFRLESGASWFLPSFARIEALLEAGGAAPPETFPAEREGMALILSRKPRGPDPDPPKFRP